MLDAQQDINRLIAPVGLHKFLPVAQRCLFFLLIPTPKKRMPVLFHLEIHWLHRPWLLFKETDSGSLGGPSAESRLAARLPSGAAALGVGASLDGAPIPTRSSEVRGGSTAGGCEILLETMGNHCLLVFTGESNQKPGFLRWVWLKIEQEGFCFHFPGFHCGIPVF